APSSAGAGRRPANSAAPPGPGKPPFSWGGQRHALATERSIGAVRHRRPEKRRPPYGSCASACRVVNATRWPPGGASVQTAIGGRKNADRPTVRAHRRAGWSTQRVGHRTEHRCSPPSAAGKNADRPTVRAHRRVGWSTQRVGHRTEHRYKPPSAAGKTPTALRIPATKGHNGRP